MEKLYKLTDRDGVTRPGEDNALQWGEKITHRATGRGGLCSSGVIHAYTSAELAAFMDPIHGRYGAAALLWEARGEVIARDGTKVGCAELTTLRVVELPTLTVEQRVEVAIRAVMAAGSAGSAWEDWAKAWIDGTDRSAATSAAATEAAAAAKAAAATEAAAAAKAAAEAAKAAAEAEDAASWAEEAAAEAAARAAALEAAAAVSRVAKAAEKGELVAGDLNLTAIIRQVLAA